MDAQQPNLPAVGDIDSNKMGTGARYNGGKWRADLLPTQVSSWFMCRDEPAKAMQELGRFQMTGDVEHLRSLMLALYSEDAIFVRMLSDAAAVLAYGAHKYKAWNWAKGMPWSVCVGCIVRHLHQMDLGKETDHESGCSHRGHVACNVLFLMHYNLYYPQGNDLPCATIEV